MRQIIFILSFILVSVNLTAQVSVSAALDSTGIMIGDQVDITLTITTDASVKLGDTDISALDTVQAIEILKIGNLNEIRKSKTGALFQQKIKLTSFEEGVYSIPPIGIPFEKAGKEGVVYSPEMVLAVVSFNVGEETELQPIKNIIEEPITIWDFLSLFLIGIPVVIVGILIWYLVRRNQRKEELAEFQKKKLPPHVIALKKLEQLQKAELWQKGEIKSFQSHLTFILREYLEERFKIPALESTSDEIISDLDKTDLNEEQTKELRNILQTADLVKFAKSEPPVEVHDKAFQNILAFVKETIPQAQPEGDQANNTTTGNTSDD